MQNYISSVFSTLGWHEEKVSDVPSSLQLVKQRRLG